MYLCVTTKATMAPPSLKTKIPPSFFHYSRSEYQAFCRQEGPKNVLGVFKDNDDPWEMISAFVKMCIHNSLFSFVICSNDNNPKTVKVWKGEEHRYSKEPVSRVRDEIISQLDCALSNPLDDLLADKIPIDPKVKNGATKFATEMARYMDMSLFVDVVNRMNSSNIKLLCFHDENVRHSAETTRSRRERMSNIMTIVYNITGPNQVEVNKINKKFLKDVDTIVKSRKLDSFICKLADSTELHDDMMRPAKEIYELYGRCCEDDFDNNGKSFSMHLCAHNTTTDVDDEDPRKVFIAHKDTAANSKKYKLNVNKVLAFAEDMKKKEKKKSNSVCNKHVDVLVVSTAKRTAEELVNVYDEMKHNMNECLAQARFTMGCDMSGLKEEQVDAFITKVVEIMMTRGMKFEFDRNNREVTKLGY